MLLLLSPLSFAGGEVPGFCWDQDATGCDVYKESNTGVWRPEHLVGSVNKDEEIVVDSEDFKFRVACHETSSKCDDGKPDWEISLASKQHTLDGIPVSRADQVTYQLDAKFNLNNGKSEERKNWQNNDNQVGGSQDHLFDKGISGLVDLTLRIPKGQAAKLKPGTHRFIFEFKGEGNYNDKVYRHLFYTFKFDIGDNKQVRISGLEPVELGTFPDNDFYSTQNFCIHASGDGKFSILAEGAGEGTSDFQLVSGTNTISYSALFGVGSNVPENSLMTMNSGTENQTFTGHDQDYCGAVGNTNMTLAIKLNESFQQLSQKPAGNYTDTLTLTVTAE